MLVRIAVRPVWEIMRVPGTIMVVNKGHDYTSDAAIYILITTLLRYQLQFRSERQET